MEVKQIEELLLQEMEEVQGGSATDGLCECPSGAAQSKGTTGTCVCTQGGAGQQGNDTGIAKCLCGANGGAAQK